MQISDSDSSSCEAFATVDSFCAQRVYCHLKVQVHKRRTARKRVKPVRRTNCHRFTSICAADKVRLCQLELEASISRRPHTTLQDIEDAGAHLLPTFLRRAVTPYGMDVATLTSPFTDSPDKAYLEAFTVQLHVEEDTIQCVPYVLRTNLRRAGFKLDVRAHSLGYGA